jgi:spore coat polysaccharide biosynthesis protein SpsF
MGSTRLPEKVLKDIGGRPMLSYVIERTQAASLLDDTIVATSTELGDDAVEQWCEDHGHSCQRGSEADVLERYYEVATHANADTIVRITADCPLISPPVIDRVVRVFHESDVDYASNKLRYTHPDGLDVEVFSFETLERTREMAETDEHREHVTPLMQTAPEFSRTNVENVVDLSAYSFTSEDVILRWTVDYPADLEFVRAIYDHLPAGNPWLPDQVAVLELLERNPELRTINDDAARTEYQ